MPTLTEKAAGLIAYLDKNAKALPKPDAPPTISELLSQSRSSHLVYRRSLRHRANGVTVDGDPTAAAEALSSSARLRALAEIRDPKHADPGWSEDLAAKFPHEALVEFYEGEVKVLVPLVVDEKPDPEPKPIDPLPVEPPVEQHPPPDPKPDADENHSQSPRTVKPRKKRVKDHG